MKVGSTELPGTGSNWWRAVLFFVGGGSGLISAVIFGLHLTDGLLWRVWALAQTLEYLAPFIALVGVYPELKDRTPLVARAGLLVAGVAITLLVVNRILLGIIGHDRPAIIAGVMLIAIIVGFLIFGIAGVRTGIPSQLLGGLMVAVAALSSSTSLRSEQVVVSGVHDTHRPAQRDLRHRL